MQSVCFYNKFTTFNFLNKRAWNRKWRLFYFLARLIQLGIIPVLGFYTIYFYPKNYPTYNSAFLYRRAETPQVRIQIKDEHSGVKQLWNVCLCSTHQFEKTMLRAAKYSSQTSKSRNSAKSGYIDKQPPSICCPEIWISRNNSLSPLRVLTTLVKCVEFPRNKVEQCIQWY